jgi:hypothetical protein
MYDIGDDSREEGWPSATADIRFDEDQVWQRGEGQPGRLRRSAASFSTRFRRDWRRHERPLRSRMRRHLRCRLVAQPDGDPRSTDANVRSLFGIGDGSEGVPGEEIPADSGKWPPTHRLFGAAAQSESTPERPHPGSDRSLLRSLARTSRSARGAWTRAPLATALVQARMSRSQIAGACATIAVLTSLATLLFGGSASTTSSSMSPQRAAAAPSGASAPTSVAQRQAPPPSGVSAGPRLPVRPRAARRTTSRPTAHRARRPQRARGRASSAQRSTARTARAAADASARPPAQRRAAVAPSEAFRPRADPGFTPGDLPLPSGPR